MSDEIGPQGLLDHVESELARDLRLERKERSRAFTVEDVSRPRPRVTLRHKNGEPIPGVWAWDAESKGYERVDGGSDLHLRRIHGLDAEKMMLTVTPVVKATAPATHTHTRAPRYDQLFRIYVEKTGGKLVGIWRLDPKKKSYERIDKESLPLMTSFIPACAMAHHGFVATLVKCPLYRLHEPHGTPIPGLWYKAQGVFKRADEEDDGHRRFITKDEARGRGLTAAQIYVPSPPAVGVGALNMAVYDPPASYGLLAAPGADDPIVPPPAPPPEEQAADEAGKPASVVEEFDTIARRMREIREAEGRQAPA